MELLQSCTIDVSDILLIWFVFMTMIMLHYVMGNINWSFVITMFIIDAVCAFRWTAHKSQPISIHHPAYQCISSKIYVELFLDYTTESHLLHSQVF